jgi:hypothetical protein
LIQSASQSESRLGFITVVETPDLGFSGGLLVVNSHGRPVEFHCTSPVKVNRAQKILYGGTYQNFLFCDQIGASLIEKARTQPSAYVTDQVDMLPLSETVDVPVLLLPSEPQTIENRIDLNHFKLNDRRLWFHSLFGEPTEPMQDLCQQFTRTLPIDEPLERIREAISEAQAVAK